MKLYKHDGFVVLEDEEKKVLRSPKANYAFDKKEGTMITWGKTLKEEAEDFPSPIVAEIELTNICSGNCKFCCNSNTTEGTYMSFEKYKELFHKLPNSLTQIAFSVDYDCSSNPDLFKIIEYTKDHGIVPNINVGSSIDDSVAKKLSSLCGAIAVSCGDLQEVCYNSVERLIKNGAKKVNINYMISSETFTSSGELLHSILYDERIKDINAVIFLSLKRKGRGKNYEQLENSSFEKLIGAGIRNNISIGFDSCSSLKLLYSFNKKNYEKYKLAVKSCESAIESMYIDVNGNFYPCSFCQGVKGWTTVGETNVFDCEDFIKDIWNHPKTENFRRKLHLSAENNRYNCRECPMYSI